MKFEIKIWEDGDDPKSATGQVELWIRDLRELLVADCVFKEVLSTLGLELKKAIMEKLEYKIKEERHERKHA